MLHCNRDLSINILVPFFATFSLSMSYLAYSYRRKAKESEERLRQLATMNEDFKWRFLGLRDFEDMVQACNRYILVTEQVRQEWRKSLSRWMD